MYRQLDCIALRTVRYNDTHSILTAYTRQAGRISLSLPAGKGRGAMRLRALLMPLGRFECVVDMRPNREIHPLRDVKPAGLPPAADPLRSSVALFVADFLGELLREQMPDPPLFAFLEEALTRLSDTAPATRMSATALANYHICFMISLTHYLGIEPDRSTYLPGRLLDMAGGVFRAMPPNHRSYLPVGESAVAERLLRMNFRNMGRYRFSRFERNTIVDRIIEYYRTHFPSFSEPGSLAVLRMAGD